MTSKERAFLRGIANTMEPVLHIGKEGITQTVTQQAWDALEAREMIKVAVQRNAPFESARAACMELCEKTHAEPVQVIGSRFVLYREARKEPHLLDGMTRTGTERT